MSLRFAYNTNGLAHHRLDDALVLLADHGYDGVALTLDHHHLDPFAPDALDAAARLRDRLDQLGLEVMIETGARFLLDPRAKHEPTLVTHSAPGRARRVDFLSRAVRIARVLRAETVSFWAGVPHGPHVDHRQRWAWLCEGVAAVARVGAEQGVPLSVEPEPGMVVEDCRQWEQLRHDVAQLAPDCPPLQLALDTGHCVVTGDLSPEQAVRTYGAGPNGGELGTVAVEDMARGVHEHLMFGEGDVDVAAVVRALADVGYPRLVTVELSRDSHRAHQLVPAVINQLRTWSP